MFEISNNITYAMVSCVAENVLHDSLCSEHLFAAASPDYRASGQSEPPAAHGIKRCQWHRHSPSPLSGSDELTNLAICRMQMKGNR